MNPTEQQYYQNLRLARIQEQEQAREQMAGQAAGAAAGAAVSATGVGLPLAFIARKAGKIAGKKAYRKRKWIIPAIIAFVIGPPLIAIALTLFIIIVSTYAVVCYNPISYLLSWIPGLNGLIPCS